MYKNSQLGWCLEALGHYFMEKNVWARVQKLLAMISLSFGVQDLYISIYIIVYRSWTPKLLFYIVLGSR